MWKAAAALVLAAVAAAGDVSWGTYRPQVYLGLRPTLPDSVLTGLAYFSTRHATELQRMRHSTEDDDGVRFYRWTHHDGRAFGIQEIVDDGLNYRLETSFVKTDYDDHPGSWAVRVNGTVLDTTQPAELSVLYYVGRESGDAKLGAVQGDDGPIIKGTHPALGAFAMHTAAPHGERTGDGEAHYEGLRVPTHEVWRAKDHLTGAFTERYQALASRGEKMAELPAADIFQLDDRAPAGATLYALQRTFRGDFVMDIFFESDATPKGARLDSDSLTVALQHRREAYETAFQRKFGLDAFEKEDVDIARELTAQIIGGIGYFSGSSLVDRRGFDDNGLVLHEPSKAEPTREPTRELLTATPSRSFFPRGFYWDEGFHQAHIGAWDPELCMDLFASWTSLIDDDGWVGREQILGPEARSRVPEEFQVQFPQFANPPALIMGLEGYLDRLDNAADVGGVGGQAAYALNTTHDLASLYEPWRRHYHWFRRTQRGQIKQWDRSATSREAYRWRGRSATHVLTSGLDDYPRAATPHVGELHLDLHAWMGGFARAMRRFAQHLGIDDDVEEYERHLEDIQANLYDLHWDEERQMFCDASVDEDDVPYLECHQGYVSLFPLLMELLEPDAPALGATLDMLGDEAQLWSPHGIRSLSAAHPMYGTGEDYWRSAIWIPINYLVLRALHAYAAVPGPYQTRSGELYAALRGNLIRTVLNEYKRTGYTWEQYDAATGAGRRNRPFAGWTSMVVLIMAEQYP